PPHDRAGSGWRRGVRSEPDPANVRVNLSSISCEEEQPFPALAPKAFFCLKQTTRPRYWCIRIVCNPYPFTTLEKYLWRVYISMMVILLNCVTLGMFQPCEDVDCLSERCKVLQVLDDCIFAFFAVEMVIKMMAFGVFGSKCYLADRWNQLDFVIVMAGMLEYSLDGQNASLSAIRTVRVLRPLRAINRVPSMRILVTLLLDTLPMLGNVLFLCFFVFFIFGIVGVQLWAGLLRNRCFLGEDTKLPTPSELECSLTASHVNGCVNWNQYYNVCHAGEFNPHKGAVNFDNIGYASIAIFQVITLEGWVDIMYFVMDAHSFYNFIYFILLIIVGSFFMINLCLVVIATQFSETKQRENALMREQRARYMSSDSTFSSYTEPGSCYEEILRYISHLYRKLRRRLQRIYYRGDGSNSSGNGHGQGSKRVSTGPGAAFWLRPIHNLMQQHRQEHCHLSNGGQHHVQTVEHMDGEEGIRGVEELEMKSLPVRIGCTNENSGDSPAGITRGSGSLDKRRVRDRFRRPKFVFSKAGHAWTNFRETLRTIVESKYFNQAIMTAILINTFSMGIEYHEQPEYLTQVLEITNFVFTSIFVLEMGFMLLAFGLWGYIKNPYNIFDSVVVIISVWEISAQADGGLSVLRTFRLLRVLKLVRFMPALRRQLVVLMKTMDNVATFCMLLMLFIFTFSILGMHLFGCKFGLRLENGDTIPDRKNFDSLLWAIVTVFQILTQEDWNVVLYNGMASTSPWAALYFVALMTFGNYVLFNLLVAILVEGFQAEVRMTYIFFSHFFFAFKALEMTANGHIDACGTTAPPIIMRTAATPMPTPTSSLGPESILGEELLYREGTPKDGESFSSPGRRSPFPPRGSSSSWGSRRSSWNSLGRAPSLKRRDTSGERESLLSEEGADEEDGHDNTGRAGPNQKSLEQPQVSSMVGEHSDCNGMTLTCSPDENADAKDDISLEDDFDEDNLKPRWCKEHEDCSLYLFDPESRFRSCCQRVISHKLFDHVVLFFIFLNCITIAMERPDIKPHSLERLFLSASNYIFTVIFLIEMAIKVVALGFCFGKQCYLQCSWNILDGLLVFVSLLDVLVSIAYVGENKILGVLRVLRLLRTLRPLRVISRAPGLKLVVETLITSLRPIGNIVLICCTFFIVFGILGVQLFKGKFFICEGFDTRNVTNKSDCLQANYRWTNRKYNFDNLFKALMSLFVLSCKDGWVNIMYDGLDAVGVDQQPVRNHNPWMLIYFISFLLIVSFFVLNMFVGVVVENFHKCRQDQEEEEARLREDKRQKMIDKKRRRAMQRPYYADYSPVRLYIHRLCTNHYLDLFITLIVGINILTMSVEHYNQQQYLKEALKDCNYVFTCIFFVEALLKLVAFGIHRFFKDKWNQLDVAIVALSILGIVLEELNMKGALPINPTIIRIMRVLRIARVLKLLKMAKGMRALLDTVMQALPQVGNLGLLFMLLFFIYAALGVELFGKLIECTDINPCEGLSRHATFENFGMAFLTLFRVSTGDNWSGIMKDTLRECQPDDRNCFAYLAWVSPFYFVTFVLIAQFVLVNVVVAVLMKHLEESNKVLFHIFSVNKYKETLLGTWMYIHISRIVPKYIHAQTFEINAKNVFLKFDVMCFFSLVTVASVNSQPCKSRSLLQVPDVSSVPPQSRPTFTLPRIVPPTTSPSPRTLHRQVSCSHDRVQEGKTKAGRSHSLSPYTLPGFVCADSSSPPPLPPLPSSSSRSALSLLGVGLKDIRKGFSVDNQGFLEKPSTVSGGYADDQRRHSIEVCLPQAVITGDPPHFKLDSSRSEKAAFPVRVQSERRGCSHRKKKMSPPCISIHPPSERDPALISSPPKLSDCSMLLRRRTPSSDSNAQDAEAHRQMPAPLTPTPFAPLSPSPQTNDPTGLKPPYSVAKVFPHTVPTHASQSGSSVWLQKKKKQQPLTLPVQGL
uniref:Calcium channel, voltage-dependent, T type, alpha 1H subunit a n=1 Tax=Oryzias latipes TaxID=8090 RepID=A0A3P9KPV4_ORYLA